MQGTERAFEETQNNPEKEQGTISPVLIFNCLNNPSLAPASDKLRVNITHFLKTINQN